MLQNDNSNSYGFLYLGLYHVFELWTNCVRRRTATPTDHILHTLVWVFFSLALIYISDLRIRGVPLDMKFHISWKCHEAYTTGSLSSHFLEFSNPKFAFLYQKQRHSSFATMTLDPRRVLLAHDQFVSPYTASSDLGDSGHFFSTQSVNHTDTDNSDPQLPTDSQGQLGVGRPSHLIEPASLNSNLKRGRGRPKSDPDLKRKRRKAPPKIAPKRKAFDETLPESNYRRLSLSGICSSDLNPQGQNCH